MSFGMNFFLAKKTLDKRTFQRVSEIILFTKVWNRMLLYQTREYYQSLTNRMWARKTEVTCHTGKMGNEVSVVMLDIPSTEKEEVARYQGGMCKFLQAWWWNVTWKGPD